MSKNAVMPMEDYVSACDSIREKTETTDLIKSGELPEKINDVYEAGQKAEHDKFWDTYQKNGERVDYQTAFFGELWNDAIFKPKYDIVLNCTRSQYRTTETFGYCGVENLQKILSDCGVSLITSGAERLNATFRGAKFKELDLDVSSCVDMSMSFYNLENLISLELRNLRADCVFDRVITFCYKLEELRITGTIGTGTGGNSSINLQYSPLTKESLLNIISCLKDFREVIFSEYKYIYSDYITEIPFTQTLVEGEQYALDYKTKSYGWHSGVATVQKVNISGVGEVLGLQYDFEHPIGGTMSKYIYQSGEQLAMHDDANDANTEVSISLTKSPTVYHTITFGTTNLDKLGNAEKQTAQMKGWTLL